MDQTERSIRDQVRASRALAVIEELCRWPDRFVGTEGEGHATAFVEEQFASLGLEVEKTPILVPSYRDVAASLSVSGRSFEVIPAYYSPSSPRDGVKAPLVFVGDGTEQSYAGRDVAGKVVVLQETGLGYSMFWLGSFAERAANRGARGLVVIHPMPWPYRMSVENGLSSIERRFPEVSVPAVCVSSVDGAQILYEIGRGGAEARLQVETEIADKPSSFLQAFLKGTDLAEERVTIIAHRDNGYPGGANDNGSGTSTLLEIARVLSRFKPRRTITFISSTAEEGATQGAWEFCRTHRSRLSRVKALINIDMIACGGRLNLVEVGHWPDRDPMPHPEWFLRLLEGIAEELGYHVGRMTASWGIAEEGRFIDEGVPAAWFWKPDDLYYHSRYDTPDKVDGNMLKVVGDIVSIAIWRLANAGHIPPE